jgi:hypothetical protein
MDSRTESRTRIRCINHRVAIPLRAGCTCSQSAMIGTLANTMPTRLLPWDVVSRGPAEAQGWTAVFPQALLRSTAPDHLPALYTRPTNTRSSSTRTRQGRTLPPWNELIIHALFLIAFFEDNKHDSRTERCGDGSPLRACQLCCTLIS